MVCHLLNSASESSSTVREDLNLEDMVSTLIT